MSAGLSWDKLLLIGLIAALLIGPERLPRYAEMLAQFISRAKEWATGARDRVKSEMGEDFEDVDWKKLDPRQYDPRRIIREALLDDTPTATVRAAGVAGAVTAVDAPDAVSPPASAAGSSGVAWARFESGEKPPFDSEAT